MKPGRSIHSAARIAALVVAVLLLGACASMQRSDPIQVAVVGVEPIQGEGLELRMLVKLRVQNPNDAPVDYDGVYLKLDVMDKTFATGVSDARGSVPRFGEAVIGVPVTVSMLRVMRQALGTFGGKATDKMSYRLSGKLNGPSFGAQRFQAQGELVLPTGDTPSNEGTRKQEP